MSSAISKEMKAVVVSIARDDLQSLLKEFALKTFNGQYFAAKTIYECLPAQSDGYGGYKLTFVPTGETK